MIHTPHSLTEYRAHRAANDNSGLHKAAMDWRIRTMQQQYASLSDAERIDCCDEARLMAWQVRTRGDVPSFMVAFYEGLLRTDEEIRRAAQILEQLNSSMGRA